MAEARKKILCIEDDRETVALLAEELAARDFEVITAYDGAEGFVSILKNAPDLILCDINLPLMSGFDVLELAPRLGHTPFVFLTALADRESELRGRRLGADDYVIKPIDFDMLETIIRARLAGIARNETWPKLAMLNDREIEALTWVARGKTSVEIAEMLGLAKRTVDFHLDNARVKLSAAKRPSRPPLASLSSRDHVAFQQEDAGAVVAGATKDIILVTCVLYVIDHGWSRSRPATAKRRQ